jgi:hypothetical protein
MPVFRVTGGALSGVMMSGNVPDNSLPGDQPGIDNSLPPYVDQGLPIPPSPPQVWPPITVGAPIAPAHPIAGAPVRPGTIWPSPGRPSHDLPHVPGHPANPLPGSPGHPSTGPVPPGTVSPPIASPPATPGHDLPSNVYWMLCYCPSLGWNFVAVDPSLSVGYPLPPHAEPK